MKNTRPREVSKEAARRFLILRQSFLQRKRGKSGALEAIKRLECVQKDPINVVHHNQRTSCFTKTSTCSSIGAMKNP